MFTGLVQTTALLEARRSRDSRSALWLQVATDFTADVAAGDSICVEGVCLTALEVGPAGFRADVSQETLARTTLGDLKIGQRLNLEKSLRASDRIGGHFVTGHVDAVGELLAIDRKQQRWQFSLPLEVRRLVASKGSVAINGVSLTSNDVGTDEFSVSLIPHTLEVTSLSELKIGDPVNLEADLLARYWQRFRETGGDLNDPFANTQMV